MALRLNLLLINARPNNLLLNPLLINARPNNLLLNLLLINALPNNLLLNPLLINALPISLLLIIFVLSKFLFAINLTRSTATRRRMSRTFRCSLNVQKRAVAQLGRAPGSGPGGRGFKSHQPDINNW